MSPLSTEPMPELEENETISGTFIKCLSEQRGPLACGMQVSEDSLCPLNRLELTVDDFQLLLLLNSPGLPKEMVASILSVLSRGQRE